MEAVSSAIEKVRGAINEINIRIKRAIYGDNNERLDFLMDSFYKLSPDQKNMVLITAVAVIFFLILGIIGIYINRVGNLGANLNSSISAYKALEEKSLEYNAKNSEFQFIVNKINSGAGGGAIKPFFENLSKKHKITLDSLNENMQNLQMDNALGTQFREANIDLRVNKISLPRLLKFLASIESEGSFYKVSDLKIEARYDDKLYFDTQIKVKGFKSK